MNIPVYCCFLVTLCLGVVIVQSGNCPKDWVFHEEFCFYLKKETYNWFDAKMVCKFMGGYLAEDSSQSRHDFLNELVNNHSYSSDFTWIGLEDFAEENVFWWSYSRLRPQSTFWGPGEPQDRHGEEDCVMLKKGLWNDLNCEDDRPHFICEKPASEE